MSEPSHADDRLFVFCQVLPNRTRKRPRMHNSLSALCLILMVGASSAQVPEDGAHTPSSDRFDFDMHISNGHGNVYIEVFSGKAAEQRIRFKSHDNEDFLGEIQEFVSNEGAEVFQGFWCDQLNEKIPERVLLKTNASSNKVYSFSPIPGPDDNKRIYKNLVATVEVSATHDQILSFSMKNGDSFSPAIATKITSFEYLAKCFPLVENRTALRSLSISVTGKAFFQTFDEVMKRTYSNYRPSE